MLYQKRYNRLVGSKFGKLLVMKSTEKRSNNAIIWECMCDCGQIDFVPSFYLRESARRMKVSCGCTRPKYF